jgi:NDP-sugar pyrophosphorylase family protein
MAETIRQIVEISSSEKFLMVMPDTYFSGAQPYEYLSNASHSLNLALWEIREEQRGKLGQVEVDQISNLATAAEDKNPLCPYKYAWGAMSFNREVISRSSDSMSSIGDVIPKLIEDGIEIHTAVFRGKYFDCGTPKEYVSLLSTI